MVQGGKYGRYLTCPPDDPAPKIGLEQIWLRCDHRACPVATHHPPRVSIVLHTLVIPTHALSIVQCLCDALPARSVHDSVQCHRLACGDHPRDAR